MLLIIVGVRLFPLIFAAEISYVSRNQHRKSMNDIESEHLDLLVVCKYTNIITAQTGVVLGLINSGNFENAMKYFLDDACVSVPYSDQVCSKSGNFDEQTCQ